MLATLKVRPRFVLVERFGLEGNPIRTLESIGKKLGVSRERVRQIENASLLVLQKQGETSKSNNLYKIRDILRECLKAYGGVVDNRTLIIKILGKKNKTINQNRIFFLLHIFKGFSYQKETGSLGGLWYLTTEIKVIKQLNKVHTQLLNYFHLNHKALLFQDIFKLMSSDEFNSKNKSFFMDSYGAKKLKTLLQASNILQQNIIQEWGLNSWKFIAQKYTRERAFLILKKYKRPLHFRELTSYMNKHWDDKKALPQTVHNVIIKYEEFAFVKSGMYILKEYKQFDVKED